MEGTCPHKIQEKNIFFGQLLCKIRAFWGKNQENSEILLIFRAIIIKIRVF